MLSAVDAIYCAAAQPDVCPQALLAIARVFDAKGMVLVYTRDVGSRTAIVSPGLEAAVAGYDREWWRHDIGVQRGLERGLLSEVGAFTDRDIATPEEFKTHPFYKDFLAKYGIGHFMGGSVSPHPNVFAAIGAQGPLGRYPYSDEDVALLAVFAGHMEKALRLSIRLIEADATNLSLGDALARLRAGVVIVDANHRVLFTNAAGKSLLEERLLRANHAGAASSGGHAALARAIAAAMTNPPPSSSQSILISGAGRERPVVAYVLPVRPRSTHAEALVTARALVLFIDQDPSAPADPSLVRSTEPDAGRSARRKPRRVRQGTPRGGLGAGDYRGDDAHSAEARLRQGRRLTPERAHRDPGSRRPANAIEALSPAVLQAWFC